MPASELLYQASLSSLQGSLAVINAQASPLLHELCLKSDHYHLQQSFKPVSEQLQNQGLAGACHFNGKFDTIVVLPSKNKQLTLSHMAEAMLSLHANGKIIMACANIYGAKSYDAALKKLAGHVCSTSKSKCRIFSAKRNDAFDENLANQWIQTAAIRRVESHGLYSQPGLFSWDHADIGSRLLLEHLPKLSGDGMDLCCGYGLLSESVLRQYTGIKQWHMVEADCMALHCAEKNIYPWQHKVKLYWQDAERDGLPKKLDYVICNPPFHAGQEQDVCLGQAIIAQACRSLKRGGQLYMVANRKLPYETILRKYLRSHNIVIEDHGFKIIRGVR